MCTEDSHPRQPVPQADSPPLGSEQWTEETGLARKGTETRSLDGASGPGDVLPLQKGPGRLSRGAQALLGRGLERDALAGMSRGFNRV